MTIYAFTGLLGQGKTFGMVEKARDMLAKERLMIFTNMAGLHFPEAVYFDHIEEIQNIQSGVVLLDEAMIVVPARFWQDTGRDLLGRFAQLRKVGLHLMYTAQLYDGVDKVLRELTNEVVDCQKWGSWFRQSKHDPSRKLNVGGRFRPYSETLANLYNTLEIISISGGSAGLPGSPGLQSVAARKRSDERARLEAARQKSGERSLLVETWESGWWGDVAKLRLGRDARRAFDWLNDNGHFDASMPWFEQVRRELKRRQWLNIFGYGPDDAPFDCTYDNPWFRNYDPLSVKLRRAKVEEERAEELLAVKRSSRSRAVAA
jgi:hypothetical protein